MWVNAKSALCENFQNPFRGANALRQQVMVDPHSPSQFRADTVFAVSRSRALAVRPLQNANPRIARIPSG
jgi:hypothetical protein